MESLSCQRYAPAQGEHKVESALDHRLGAMRSGEYKEFVAVWVLWDKMGTWGADLDLLRVFREEIA